MRSLSLALLVIAGACAGCGSADRSATPARAAATPANSAATSANSAATPANAAAVTTRAAVTPAAVRRSVKTRLRVATPGVAARQVAGHRVSAPRPQIVWDPVPFGAARKAQMVAYVRRHYASFMTPTWRLVDPHVIVIHYTDAGYSSTYNTFAADVPDSELHELPATSAHFVIDTDGTIHQLVSLRTMARHTVGLNWTSIGIEHVGFSDAQVLGDRRQISASLKLVHWLRCRFKIKVENVIGHNESLASPYHHEDVPSLQTQTHGDFKHADMQIYRSRLRRLGGC